LASTDQTNPDQITPEAITGPGQRVAGHAQSAASNLPSALEPELRRIIDTAVARVAAIELEAIREARELTQRSEQEARDALRFALDRAFNLINSLELLANTVNGMAEALKVELDDAITALRNVPEPESELSRELSQQPEPPQAPEPEPTPVPEATPEPEAAATPETEPEPEPEPEPQPEQPEPEPQPVATEQPAEPRVKLAPLVRPAAQPAEQVEAGTATEQAAEGEGELATVGSSPDSAQHKAQPAHKRMGRVRRFFTR
jgi:hypothetical protein